MQTILATVHLKDGSSTGRTRHTVRGRVLGPGDITELRIVQFDAQSDYYLLYFDEHGRELTDTFHETLEGALSQARFEFDITREAWSFDSRRVEG